MQNWPQGERRLLVAAGARPKGTPVVGELTEG